MNFATYINYVHLLVYVDGYYRRRVCKPSSLLLLYTVRLRSVLVWTLCTIPCIRVNILFMRKPTDAH
jgi:hypothetical protein